MTKSTNLAVALVKPTAILVDGSFFLKRYKHCYPDGKSHDAKTVVKNMYTMLLSHVENEQLYRILYYVIARLFLKKLIIQFQEKALISRKLKFQNFELNSMMN